MHRPQARSLVIGACQRLCAWDKTDETIANEPVYACAGCGSEWTPSQRWTPVDADGVVPEAVQEERRGRR